MADKITFNVNNQMLPMPMSLTRLATLVVDMNSSIEEFKHVIELDQALVAHVLKWVNTSFSLRDQPLNNIKDAINELGTANIIKLAMGQTFIASTGEMSSKQNYAENALWYHGIATAHAAQYLADLIDQPVAPIVFTAGLIHDVGKLLLGRHVGFEMLEIALQKEAESKEISFLEAEQKLLGIDHVEMGSDLARNWKFPELLIECIEAHHQKEPHEHVAVNIVILADAIGKLVHPGINSNIDDMVSLQKVILHLGLEPNCIYELIVKVKEGMSQATGLWYDNQPEIKNN